MFDHILLERGENRGILFPPMLDRYRQALAFEKAGMGEGRKAQKLLIGRRHSVTLLPDAWNRRSNTLDSGACPWPSQL
jgi:hypothetical protein